MKRSSAPSAATISRLVEPTSVTTVSGPEQSRAARGQLGEGRHRGRAEDQIGALAGFRHRDGGTVDHRGVDGAIQGRAVGVIANHRGAQPLPRSKPDRAPDQAHPEDRDPHP